MGDLIVHGFKIAFFISIATAFLIALNALINLIVTAVFPGVLQEVFAVISCCLPFNALSVFSAIGTSLDAILAFLLAQKIFDLSGYALF